MPRACRRATLISTVAAVLTAFAPAARAQVSLTTLGTAYTQSFDSLPASGSATWTDNSTIPGWYHARTGTGTTIVANNGGSNAGNLYSYGTGTATDRALGSLGSGNAAVGNLFWGVRLQNNTGATITSLAVSYTGEQWRNSAAAAQALAFSYLVGSPTVTGSLAEFQSAGVAVAALDFTSPVTGGTAGALDGNASANRAAISFTISGLSIPNGTEVMLRWSDPDHTGADHGLSIDDFSLTPQGAPALPTLNVTDVTLSEGAAATTTTFTFAVTLTAPAGPGGVTFDIATADGTARDDNPSGEDEDYVANSLTGQTIPAGSTGPYHFDVTVNGDDDPEPTETFFVNVTDIVGATAGDVQGLGTIVTDDAPPSLSVGDVSQVETNSGTTTFTFTVSLDGPAPLGGVSFDVATAPDTATAGTDYVHAAETGRTIAEGDTSATFAVTVNGDTLFEPNETFFVDVTSVVGADVTDGQGLGTILDDDTQPTFAIADAKIVEGDGGTQALTFTVTMTGAAEADATVAWATADATATEAGADYVADSGTLTFASGDTSETFTVFVNGDVDTEGDEHFLVNLSGATVATIADGQAFGVIANDDPIAIPIVDTPVTEDFDSLQQAASPSTVPGWTFAETDTNANLTYSAGTGSSGTGDSYSFGVAGTNPASDRAFGGLQSGSLVPTVGAYFRNETGVTVTTLSIQYTGEQWRLGTAGRADRLDFQYSLDAASLTDGGATWTHVDELDFTTPNQATIGLKDGNAAANRTLRAFTIGGLAIADGETFWIRFTDFNASGADDGLAVDDFSVIANFSGSFLSVDDVSAFEGDAGVTTFTFTVSLSQPAPPGGVTFDFATVDGTATDPGDYTAVALAGQTIAEGESSMTFDVEVQGDSDVEPTETFFVEVTAISGALPADTQGMGTIIDDDSSITFIHDVQGPGGSSPIVGSAVTVQGIVTGVKSNGFFVQEEEADYDADPATSEGVFVFTGGTPPVAATFGALVQVGGTVAEFVPSGDPQQPPLTELVTPSVALIAIGQPLPAPVPLSATFPDPVGPFDQLERVEGMRVSVGSLTVSAPSDGSFFESTATGTSNGRFFGTVTGVPRPFLEAGIRAPDLPPTGTIPPIPRWDFNPERLKVESATLGQPILTVKTGDVVGPLVGPLDYAFRAYAIYPDGTTPVTMTPGPPLATTVNEPTPREVTIGSFNIQRLFDTVNDPGGDPVLTPAAYENRLSKASIAIRDHLHMPDVLGVQEIEKLEVLEDLAARISADALAAVQPDPMYVAYLVEGNDIGGIDVGFLVKTAEVAPGLPRVEVIALTQEGATTTWADPTGGTPLLNDRPPLVLVGTVHRAPGISFDVTVINNHLRSLNGIADETPSGATTNGDRVRRKRLAQAQFLADLVQARQTADSSERIVLVGDFNAFEVNDGYADVINTILGTPPPGDETVVPGDGIDLVDPDLVNLVATPPPAERYSYVFEGNAQNIDHVIVNQAVVATTTARRIEHPRINADYPDTERNNPATALRSSDHDPTLAYLELPALADLSIAKAANGAPVAAGSQLPYTITFVNDGPDAATDAEWTDPLPAGTTFTSLVAPAGWSCTTPAVEATGTVSCSIATFPVGDATFTLTVRIDSDVAPDTVIENTVTATSTTADPDSGGAGGDPTDTETTTVGAITDLPLELYTVTPCRLVDTRTTANPLSNGETLAVEATGACGIPSGARAVVVNLTAVAPTGAGALDANRQTVAPFPADVTIAVRAGVTRASNGIALLDGDGRLHLQATLDGGEVHAVVDVVGYLAEAVPSSP